MNPESEEQQQKPNVIAQQGKKLLRQKAGAVGKKAAKVVAKAAVKGALALGKFLLSALLGLGTPVLLGIGAIVLIVLIIYLASTLFFADPSMELEGDAKGLRNHIIKEADKTVDMSKPEQVPYRVPPELIMAALNIYESGDHGVSEKEAASIMAKQLAPIFSYAEFEGKLETVVTTCVDGKCRSSTSNTPFKLKPLERVEAWNKVIEATFTPHTTDWVETTTSHTTYESREKRDENGKVIRNEYEVVAVVTTTTTKTRAHTVLEDSVENEDYTYFDRVLSDTPFEYGIQDKKIVEAMYESAGGFIQYSTWLTGNSLIGFNGSVIPGLNVPAEYMEIYLAAEKRFKVDWFYLAAFHFTETGFSTHPTMISSVGAEGHMQFMPCTFVGWSYPGCMGGNGFVDIPTNIKTNLGIIKQYGGYGTDGNGDGKADPWDVWDAIFTAANYLNKSGFSTNIDKAIYNYNHSDVYVANIKAKAMEFKTAAQYIPADGTIPSLAPGSFMRPAMGSVTSLYGPRVIAGKKGTFHYGVDIANARDTPIVAMADGVVTMTNSGCPDGNKQNTNCSSGWGNHVRIQHTVNGRVYEAVYAHFTKLAVAKGQTVKQGQLIGYMGMSGQVTGIHLHVELYNGPFQKYGINNLNPSLYIPF